MSMSTNPDPDAVKTKKAGPPPPLEPLVDTHAHLDDPRMRPHLGEILARARRAGVVQVVAIGTTAADSADVAAIAGEQPGVFAAVGFQPNNVVDAVAGDWGRIVELAARPRVVALGETGLDRHWDRSPFGLQQEWFQRHLDLARERDLPVVIHCRECEADVVAQLAGMGGPVRGVLHSFTGGREQAEAFLGLGLHISFAGMLTFANKNLDALREAAAAVPLDRLLVETDSPYLTPHPLRGRGNEPAFVTWTARKLAEIHGVSDLELARIVTANARALFRLPDADLILAPARGEPGRPASA
ncbi:TatD family hydrolase [Paludisphaera mucosa]|uniref:TatD family hydrolase n=1 Tax=Paludisphaera mucosa TaxID=3030827 RepID=A0ABT6FC45_9BACT|nr:TatD family hydrolase [Paludisphaera mucosa]MDG3005105.1 TatD family hydrolase [Paludisphaera mucosa]